MLVKSDPKAQWYCFVLFGIVLVFPHNQLKWSRILET
jgi:hypothetical protein